MRQWLLQQEQRSVRMPSVSRDFQAWVYFNRPNDRPKAARATDELANWHEARGARSLLRPLVRAIVRAQSLKELFLFTFLIRLLSVALPEGKVTRGPNLRRLAAKRTLHPAFPLRPLKAYHLPRCTPANPGLYKDKPYRLHSKTFQSDMAAYLFTISSSCFAWYANMYPSRF